MILNQKMIKKYISRTVLKFLLVNRYNSEHVISSNENCLHVNLNYTWKYCLKNWIRISNLKEYDFIYILISMFLFPKNYHDYVYYYKNKMTREKYASIIGNDNCRNYAFNDHYSLAFAGARDL